MPDSHTTSTARSATTSSASNANQNESRSVPIHVVDLGKAKSGDVKDLKKGRGKLLDDVTDTIVDLEATLPEASRGRGVLPVVMIVERKRKQKKILL